MSTYNPPRFEIKNHELAIEFMIKNSFATVISVVDNEPIVSQVPITVVQKAEEVFLVGHFARQNPHANVILKGLSERSDEQSQHVLTDMRHLYNQDGTLKK